MRRIVLAAVVAIALGFGASSVTADAAPAVPQSQVPTTNESVCVDLSNLGLPSVCLGQLLGVGEAFAL